MKRVNKTNFRSNIEQGGIGTALQLTPEIKQLAERASNAFGLDYAGVDILSNGKQLYVCEVNSNAFFDGITKATSVDIAKLYAQYIVSLFS